jgi:hypothetical protein
MHNKAKPGTQVKFHLRTLVIATIVILAIVPNVIKLIIETFTKIDLRNKKNEKLRYKKAKIDTAYKNILKSYGSKCKIQSCFF